MEQDKSVFKKLENEIQDECSDVKKLQKIPNIKQVNNMNQVNNKPAITKWWK